MPIDSFKASNHHILNDIDNILTKARMIQNGDPVPKTIQWLALAAWV